MLSAIKYKIQFESHAVIYITYPQHDTWKKFQFSVEGLVSCVTSLRLYHYFTKSSTVFSTSLTSSYRHDLCRWLMWAKQVLSSPEWVSKRPAEMSVLCSVARERDRTACVCGADVWVYDEVSGWIEYQRELGWMDVQRTGPAFLKTPVKNTYKRNEVTLPQCMSVCCF